MFSFLLFFLRITECLVLFSCVLVPFGSFWHCRCHSQCTCTGMAFQAKVKLVVGIRQQSSHLVPRFQSSEISILYDSMIAVAEWIHMCAPFFGIPTRWTCLITVGCLHLIHLWNPWRNSLILDDLHNEALTVVLICLDLLMVCTSNFVRSTTCEIGLSEKCVPLDTLLYHVFYGHRLGYPHHFQIKIAPCALSVSVSCGGLLGFGIEFQQRFFASATENEPTHWSKTDGYYMLVYCLFRSPKYFPIDIDSVLTDLIFSSIFSQHEFTILGEPPGAPQRFTATTVTTVKQPMLSKENTKNAKTCSSLSAISTIPMIICHHVPSQKVKT